MQVRIPYGKTYLKVNVPKGTFLLKLKQTPCLSNPKEKLKQCLQSPIGTMPFQELLNFKKPENACVVISDHTRSVPNKLILSVLLTEMKKAGISESNITILIANGMHRKTTDSEKLELVGKEILNKYHIRDHEAENDEHIFFQIDGVSATVNKLYLKSEFKILTGLIEPHFMAGFSGGRKSICPGISGIETVKYFHSPELLESPYAKSGILKNNPCHKFSLKLAKKAGADFIINVTLNSNKKISGIFCGDLEKAHLSGTKLCEAENSVCLNEPVDIVITSNGGYPLDRDFYQTVKGLVGVLDIIRPGGLIICASECLDGIGSIHFKKLLSQMKSPDQFLTMISKPGYFHMDMWEVEELAKVLKKARVKLYSTCLTGDDIKQCHLESINSIEQAIKNELKRVNESKSIRIAVVPDGPYAITKRRD